MNIGKRFKRWFCLVRVPPALKDAANLIQETPFYFKLNFSGRKVIGTSWPVVSLG